MYKSCVVCSSIVMWRMIIFKQHHLNAASRTQTQQNRSYTRIYLFFPKNDQPSFDLFFLTRVPPNFPRKDSSFFILCVFADVVPDIFGVHVMRSRAVCLVVTPSGDAFMDPSYSREKTETEHSLETNRCTERTLIISGVQWLTCR